jgi:hypothetical protein
MNLKFKRLPNEHVVSTLVRKRIQLAFPSNDLFMEHISLACSYPKPHDLCNQVFDASRLIADGDHGEVLLDGTTWAVWRLSESDDVLLEAIAEQRNANLRQAELGFNRHWHFCLECIKQDKIDYGVSYWHTDHQIPSITHCIKHGCPLHIAPPMESFKRLVLPQYVNLAKASQHSASSQLYDWSCFITKIVEHLKQDEATGRQLLDWLRRELPFRSAKGEDITRTCMRYMDKFESDVNDKVLKHLFNYYKRDDTRRRLNLIRSALLSDSTITVRNPVYFLVLIYWLKDIVDLPNGFGDVKTTA